MTLPDRANRPDPRRARAAAVIAWIGLLVPAVGALAFILSFGVAVPVWDEWVYVPLLLRSYDGGVTLGDLWAQHNEHRILLARVVMLVLDHIFKFDNRAEMIASWVALVISCGVLLRRWIHARGAEWPALLAFLPISGLFFSLRQFENLLWGFQIQMVGCTTFVVCAAVQLATPRSPRHFAGALGCAIGATLSFSSGLLVWPAGLIQMLAMAWARPKGQHLDRRDLSQLAIWCGVALIAFGAYFWGYQKPSHHPSLLFVVRDPQAALDYFAAAVGNALGWTLGVAWSAGAILGVAQLLVLWRAARRDASLPPETVGMVVFSLGTALVITVSRGGFGAGQALSSRYATFAMIGIAGAYLALWPRGRDAVRGFVAGLIVLGVVASVSDGLTAGRTLYGQREDQAGRLAAFRVETDERLFELGPNRGELRQLMSDMERLGLGVFKKSPKRLSRRPSVGREPALFLDRVDGAPVVPGAPLQVQAGNSDLSVEGWAGDTASGEVPTAVVFKVDGEVSTTAECGVSRPDVARAFNEPRLGSAGFHAHVPLAGLAKGAHQLSVEVRWEDGGSSPGGSPVALELR